MVFGAIQDPTGRIDFSVFPKILSRLPAEVLVKDEVVILRGELELRHGNFQCLVNDVTKVDLGKLRARAIKEGSFDPEEKITEVRRVEQQEEETENLDTVAPKIIRKKTPFIIPLAENISPKILNSIKKILTTNKGDTPVEIHLKGSSPKRIRVPFGVMVDEGLKQEISNAVR